MARITLSSPIFPLRAPATPASVDPDAAVRRLTYFMLLRVVVTSLLLGTAVAANMAEPEAPSASRSFFIFAIIAITYGLTVVWAVLLRRGARPARLAAAQFGCDVATTTL